VSLTPPKNLSAVSLTPVNNFSAVSLTPVIIFGFWVIYDRYQRHRGKILLSLTPAINCIDDRGLLLLQNYPRPQKSATAADIVIGTAMKTRKCTFWRPQGPLIKMCGVFLDATFHGGSNDTIGGRGRLRRPDILPIYPLQLSPFLGSSPPPWRPCSCDRQ
jgi:hypothetical protein